MIISNLDKQLRLVRQTDHAALSGVLALEWGNEKFQRPEPFDPMVLAALLHDNGWEEWDAAPRVNPASHAPYQFTEMPPREHLTFYTRGVERVVNKDRYAGLMVAMHCAGLYQRRFGLDLNMPARKLSAPDEKIIQEFLHDLERQQKRLLCELQEVGLPDQLLKKEHVWVNYQLLQIYDRLSLFLCMPPLASRMLGPAPLDYEGKETTLSLKVKDAHRVQITPYPFQKDPLHVAITARLIPAMAYETDAQLHEILDEADCTSLEFELMS